jgi:hypothetical protein
MRKAFQCWLRAGWLIAVVAVAGVPATLQAQAAPSRASKPEVRKDVVAVIEGQLEGFRAKDAKKAYTFAAAALRAQTPLLQFQRIVEANYPEIWKNTRAEIGLVRDDGARATVLVQVFAQDGSAGYDYGLVKERDGVWRIDSVLRHSPKKEDKL